MTPALPTNAADPDEVKRRGTRQTDKRRAELADLREILSSPVGRRVIWARLEKCGVFRSVWANSALIHFNEGRRDVGLELMTDIAQADENAFLRMMQEARTREGREHQDERKAAEEAQKTNAIQDEL